MKKKSAKRVVYSTLLYKQINGVKIKLFENEIPLTTWTEKDRTAHIINEETTDEKVYTFYAKLAPSN